MYPEEIHENMVGTYKLDVDVALITKDPSVAREKYIPLSTD